jgi:hypothetical protein
MTDAIRLQGALIVPLRHFAIALIERIPDRPAREPAEQNASQYGLGAAPIRPPAAAPVADPIAAFGPISAHEITKNAQQSSEAAFRSSAPARHFILMTNPPWIRPLIIVRQAAALNATRDPWPIHSAR